MWIKLETSFFTHIKTKRLHKLIGESAFWVPIRLWTFCALSQEDGVLSDYSFEEIAEEIGFPIERAKTLISALLEVGFLDERPLRVHKWAERNEYHQKNSERATKAANARWQKESSPSPLKEKKDKIRGEEISKHAPSISQILENPNKNAKSTDAPSMLKHCSSIAPSMLQASNTENNGANSTETQESNGFVIDRPTKTHFISHADRIGFPVERAEMLWNLLENSEWKDSKGQTIRNWKAKLGYAHSDWVEKGRPALKANQKEREYRRIGEVGFNGEIIEW